MLRSWSRNDWSHVHVVVFTLENFLSFLAPKNNINLANDRLSSPLPIQQNSKRLEGSTLISYPWAAKGNMTMIHHSTGQWRAIKTHPQPAKRSHSCFFIIKTEILVIMENTLRHLLSDLSIKNDKKEDGDVMNERVITGFLCFPSFQPFNLKAHSYFPAVQMRRGGDELCK